MSLGGEGECKYEGGKREEGVGEFIGRIESAMRQTRRLVVPVNSATAQSYCPPHPLPAIVGPISAPLRAKRKVSLFY